MDNHGIVQQAKSCLICAPYLVHGFNPVFSVHPRARILIIGQAPGKKVHETGIPWDDASGRRLRQWLMVDDATFYEASIFAMLPMGFCYPGKGTSGDLPPRPECAPKWHDVLIKMMPGIELTLLFGKYAQERYLGNLKENTLTSTVKNWRSYIPKYLPLPHPSPRNQIWEKKNPWFAEEVLPYLKTAVEDILR